MALQRSEDGVVRILEHHFEAILAPLRRKVPKIPQPRGDCVAHVDVATGTRSWYEFRHNGGLRRILGGAIMLDTLIFAQAWPLQCSAMRLQPKDRHMRLPSYRDLPIGAFYNAEQLGPTLQPTEHAGWWLYTPATGAPLSFIRPGGDVIEPPEFFTDLGTIPPLFRIGRLLQPESLPAVALVHDWVVRQNNCGQSHYDFAESIRIQQEALKTWMETHPRDRSLIVFYLSRMALRTRRSQRGWCYRFDTCPPSLDEVRAAQQSL